MPTVFSLLLLPSIVFAALREPEPPAALECDGKDFVCNHTDTHFAIDSVHLESASNNHWSAGDTVAATFSVSLMRTIKNIYTVFNYAFNSTAFPIATHILDNNIATGVLIIFSFVFFGRDTLKMQISKMGLYFTISGNWM